MHFADAVVSGDQEYSPWPHAAGVYLSQCAELSRGELQYCSNHHPGGGSEDAAEALTKCSAAVERQLSTAAFLCFRYRAGPGI